MIPLVLELKNFLSYGEAQSIDFTNHNLICLTGKNGHGKSAILDAITWALWGQARKPSGTAKPDESLLKVGQNKMLVILDFEAQGCKFRIRREFVKNLNRSIATLDFFVWDDQKKLFTSLTDKTIRQTQYKINQALKIDFETFVNSSFLRQGNSNEFSKKNPRERKNLLAKILGLEKFDSFQQKTNELLRENKLQQKEMDVHREKNNEKIKEKENFLVCLKEIKEKLAASKQVKESLQEVKALLEEKRIKLNIIIEEVAKLVHEKEALKINLSDWGEKLKTVVQKIKNTHKILFDETDVLFQHESVDEAFKKSESQLLFVENSLLEKSGLTQQLFNLQQESEKEAQTKQQLFRDEEKKLDNLNQEVFLKVEALTSRLKNEEENEIFLNRKRLDLQAKKLLVHAKIEALKNCQVEYQDLIKKKEKLTAKLTRFKIKVDSFQNLGLQGDVNLVNKDCPFCSQKINLEICLKIKNKHQLIIFQLNKLQKIIPNLIAAIEEKSIAIKVLEQKVQDLNFFEQEAANLTSQQKEIDLFIDEKAILLKTLKKDHDILTLQLDNLKKERDLFEKNYKTAFANKTEKELLIEQIIVKLVALENVEKDFEKAKSENLVLQKILKKKEEKKLLQEEQKNLWTRFLELKHFCKNTKKQLLFLDQKIGDSDKIKKEYFLLKTEYQTNQQKLYDEDKKLTNLLQDDATIHQKIRFLEDLEEENIRLTEKINFLIEEASLFEIIAEGFGKDGVQALLIEEMLPEIEFASNNILDLISETHAKIFIEPLRDLKRGGLKESLDIIISDQNGIRDYEMFSGGEAFRIDFALRIGISQVIARRAGAPLKTLIIDEGFGSLDEEGINLIMNCIYKISDLFSKIIIVSHLQTIKEMFPVHILVNKVANSSSVAIEYRG